MADEKVTEVPTLLKDASERQYLPGDLLGTGGFATCWRTRMLDSRHLPEASECALKAVKAVLPKKISTRFKLELAIQSKLHHVNIVEMYRAFTCQDVTYVALELCPNGSLTDMVKRRKFLTMGEIRRMLIQLCGAVNYLHQRDVVHRDIKAGNIFLDDKMNVKLGDFGLAAIMERADTLSYARRTTFCGTPNYLAPEILCKGTGHGISVDIWAIGVLAYYLAVGRAPFHAKSKEEIYERLRTGEYSWPELAPEQNEIPEDLRALVSSLLVEESHRPTPDQIVQHPFFTRGFIPPRLDPLCRTRRPKWSRVGTQQENYETYLVLCRTSNVGLLQLTENTKMKRKKVKSLILALAEEYAHGIKLSIPLREGLVYTGRPYPSQIPVICEDDEVEHVKTSTATTVSPGNSNKLAGISLNEGIKLPSKNIALLESKGQQIDDFIAPSEQNIPSNTSQQQPRNVVATMAGQNQPLTSKVTTQDANLIRPAQKSIRRLASSATLQPRPSVVTGESPEKITDRPNTHNPALQVALLATSPRPKVAILNISKPAITQQSLETQKRRDIPVDVARDARDYNPGDPINHGSRRRDKQIISRKDERVQQQTRDLHDRALIPNVMEQTLPPLARSTEQMMVKKERSADNIAVVALKTKPAAPKDNPFDEKDGTFQVPVPRKGLSNRSHASKPSHRTSAQKPAVPDVSTAIETKSTSQTTSESLVVASKATIPCRTKAASVVTILDTEALDLRDDNLFKTTEPGTTVPVIPPGCPSSEFFKSGLQVPAQRRPLVQLKDVSSKNQLKSQKSIARLNIREAEELRSSAPLAVPQITTIPTVTNSKVIDKQTCSEDIENTDPAALQPKVKPTRARRPPQDVLRSTIRAKLQSARDDLAEAILLESLPAGDTETLPFVQDNAVNKPTGIMAPPSRRPRRAGVKYD